MNTIRNYARLLLPGSLERIERAANEQGDLELLDRAVRMTSKRNGVYVSTAISAIWALGIIFCPEYPVKAFGGLITVISLPSAGIWAHDIYRIFFERGALAQPNAAPPQYV